MTTGNVACENTVSDFCRILCSIGATVLKRQFSNINKSNKLNSIPIQMQILSAADTEFWGGITWEMRQ